MRARHSPADTRAYKGQGVTALPVAVQNSPLHSQDTSREHGLPVLALQEQALFLPINDVVAPNLE